MMVRKAYMTDGTTYEVSAFNLQGCFERGYVYGVGCLGNQYLLNVSHIRYFGPCVKGRFPEEVYE